MLHVQGYVDSGRGGGPRKTMPHVLCWTFCQAWVELPFYLADEFNKMRCFSQSIKQMTDSSFELPIYQSPFYSIPCRRVQRDAVLFAICSSGPVLSYRGHDWEGESSCLPHAWVAVAAYSMGCSTHNNRWWPRWPARHHG